MTVTIRAGQPEEALDLLEKSHALMQALYPPESNHALPVAALSAPNTVFLVAEQGTDVIGCAALVFKDGYCEIKSMFVDGSARGTGTGTKLIHAMERTAKDKGYSMMRLETGNELTEACRLYKRSGFAFCPPFGSYTEDPYSVYMEKHL